eukprot:5737737-Pleurochrysis_carterae.AAC.1
MARSHHSRSRRVRDGVATVRAGEREVFPTHHPPLGVFDSGGPEPGQGRAERTMCDAGLTPCVGA